MPDLTKSPRVYIHQDLSEGLPIVLGDGAHHYLKNVMRVVEGDVIRVFNGRHGEFAARVERAAKKNLEITLENRVRAQQNPARAIHLLFPPLRKERLDWLIEKSVEIGVTDLRPILTHNTDIRRINAERIEAQIIEAAEQCERLDIPALHEVAELSSVLAKWDSSIKIHACVERMGTETLMKDEASCALLIGPPGGFTAEEKEVLAGLPAASLVSLGHNILRTETAAIAGLSILTL